MHLVADLYEKRESAPHVKAVAGVVECALPLAAQTGHAQAIATLLCSFPKAAIRCRGKTLRDCPGRPHSTAIESASGRLCGLHDCLFEIFECLGAVR